MVLYKVNQNSENKAEGSEASCSTSKSAKPSNKPKISQRLDKVLETNRDYHFVQQNGQRIFEPQPSTNFNPPSRGCEIFIGNIPKFLYEDELIPLFQQVGEIYKFRLMLDFNDKNRGYAFATYFFAHHATEAIQRFNGFKLTNGATLAVFKSVDNRRLFVGNIPRSKTREDLRELFFGYVDGLFDVIMYPGWHSDEANRGFAFLEFESHCLASVARRQLHPRNLVMWNQALYVDWADPIPDPDPVVMAQVTVLYVKNLPLDFTNDQLYALLRNVTGPRRVKKTHKVLTYAFVHCYDRFSAEIVKGSLTGWMLNDQTLEIEWARPRQYSNQWRAMQPPENYCLSVPMRCRQLIRAKNKARKDSSSAVSETGSKTNSSPCSSSQAETEPFYN